MATGRPHLTLLLVGSLILSGCVGSPLVETVDHQIQVVNNDDVTHELRIVVASEDRVVVNRTVTVDPEERQLVTAIGEAGEYRVTVTAENGSRIEHRYSLPAVEGDRRSFLEVFVEGDGDLGKALYWEE